MRITLTTPERGFTEELLEASGHRNVETVMITTFETDDPTVPDRIRACLWPGQKLEVCE